MRQPKAIDQEIERIRERGKRQRAYEALEAEWAGRKARWVDSVWRQMMIDMSHRARYLYVQRSTVGGWGELITILEDEEAPAGCELACTERVPAGSKAEIAHWLNKFSARLPVMPTGDL
jgi:hypothetical protein